MNDKNKKIKLIIISTLLGVLFIGYGINIKSTPETREKKIISYLEKKYNSQFEIIKLNSSGENILIPKIGCDGTIFCQEIKEKGVYYYKYEVLSVLDNVVFEVKYLDRKFSDKIIETTSYYSIANRDIITQDIKNYVISVLGNEDISIEGETIIINKDFDKICDNDYIKKIEKISTYVKEKNRLDFDLHIFVYLKYSNNILVTIGYSEPIVTKRSKEEFEDADGIAASTGEYLKIYNSIKEYLER